MTAQCHPYINHAHARATQIPISIRPTLNSEYPWLVIERLNNTEEYCWFCHNKEKALGIYRECIENWEQRQSLAIHT